MEEAVCACADRLVAIYAPRAKHADRRFLLGHDARLNAGCMCAQQDVGRLLYAGFFLDKERVLHVACRMFGRKVQHAEYVAVVLYFRSVSHHESDARKDVNYLLTHE